MITAPGTQVCKGVTLTVVSPTYNEADNIENFVNELIAVLNGADYEILLVDDDSPDQTWRRAEEMSRRIPQVRSLRRTAARGLTPAVIEGFNAALGEVVACMDADLQHDPVILPRMLRELEQGADLVVGSRYVEGGGTGQWRWFRRSQSYVATKMARIFLGVELRDPMSGYFLMRRSDFLPLRDVLDTKGFKILLEITAQFKPKRIVEVPYVFRTRVAGKSKLSPRVMWQYLQQLLRLSRGRGKVSRHQLEP